MTPLTHFRKPKRFISNTLQRYSPRGLLLYFLPLALIPATIIALGKGNLLGIIVNATGFALYVFAAWCLRKGLQAETAIAKNPITRTPKLPLKMLAAIISVFIRLKPATTPRPISIACCRFGPPLFVIKTNPTGL